MFLGTSQTFVALSAQDKFFFSSDTNLLCFDFFIFSSDRKECQLICKVFTLFSFFLDNFSSFFVLELCSFSLGKNVTQGILLYQIFWASFSCLQNYHHITQKGLICSKTNDIFPKRYKFWESPRTLQLLVRGICFFLI